jgi:predicted signal transduction protein with EAL and GGDEF domain
MFRAAALGDVSSEIKIDHTLIDPAFTTMQDIVYSQAYIHEQITTAASRRLLHVETIGQWATSLAGAVGLLLVALFGRMRLHYGRETAKQGRQNAYQATHDALTGLPNRLLFSEELDGELDRAKYAGASVGVGTTWATGCSSRSVHESARCYELGSSWPASEATSSDC